MPRRDGLAVVVMVNSPNVAGEIATAFLKTLCAALDKAAASPPAALPDFSDYTGQYTAQRAPAPPRRAQPRPQLACEQPS